MFRTISNRVLLPMLAGALALTACGKDEPEPAATSLLTSSDTVLRYVPADTPYVFASVEPLPDELMDKLEPKFDRILASYQTILREIVAQHSAKMSEDEQNSEEAQALRAVIDELTTLLSVDGLRAAGVGRDATGAIYGNGMLPVVRWDLTDGALFDAAISRLEEKAGEKMSVAAIEGGGYRYMDFEQLRLIIAILSDQAVITFVPADFPEPGVAAALGLTPPARSIADAGTLGTIAQTYGFTPHFAGLIDLQAIAAVFTQPQTGINAALLEMSDAPRPDLSAACKAEIQAMVGIAPRVVMGYDEIDTERLASTMIVELRQDIAAGLSGLTAPVPGLGGDKGGVMSFGMSLDVDAARKFVEARIDAIEADPYECEYFANLQAGVAGARQSLSQPVPPMVYDFKGFLAVIDEIEGLDVATQTPPTSVEGSFMLAMDNAQALVAMGAMFSPELAALNLQPDGKPVALALPQLQMMGLSAFAALTEGAVAIGVGDGAESEVATLLGASVGESRPFLSFSMDAARYYTFLGEAMAAAEPEEGDDQQSPELQAAMNEMMLAAADLYDRLSTDVFLTSKGVEIKSVVTLGD